MKIEIHHHHHYPDNFEVARLLGAIERKLDPMSAALDRLTKEVAETKDATQSAIKLIDGLADQIRSLKDDPAKLEALADELDAQQAEIAAKVTENTSSP